MRSIFWRVLLWAFVTFVMALLSFWTIERMIQKRDNEFGDPIRRMVDFVQEDACRAYEEGGPAKLSVYLKRVETVFPGEHLLTDPNGTDLATGRDQSALLAQCKANGPPVRREDGCFVHLAPAFDPHYRFITISKPWPPRRSIWPYFGAVVLVVALMASIFAAHLAGPLRRLERAVNAFGGGDLSSRSNSKRGDEIGQLSRAFDDMAGRIETLLSAERRLLQDVSHELRSPLARMGVAIELALSNDNSKPALGRIKRDIGRLGELVGELVHLTRAEGDPTSLAFAPVQLRDLVGAIVDDCNLEARAKHCEIHLSAPTIAALRGDSELLRRAVENVVRNAVRHSPEKTLVDVAINSSEECVEILVRDRGAGVPEAQLGLIFEPFFRVEGHRSRESGGVGLGLAIARRAVLLHRGSIFASNSNPGLLVTIELPRQRLPRDAEPLFPNP